MKIVITGALGHIGSFVIRELPKKIPGLDIVMIDNMSTQRYASLFNLPDDASYRFIEADVLDTDLVPLVDGADIVLHLAAITNATASFSNKEEVERVNFNATVRVAESCVKTGASLIHISSTSVYGTQNDVVDEFCKPEELKPQSPYAETKLREEEYLINLVEKAGLSSVICRFGTICGVSPGMRFHTAINKFCWQAVLGQPLTIWRTALHQKRPYLDLNEALAAFYFIIENELFDGHIYNVLTANFTVDEITSFIKPLVPELTIEFVDSEIMNQLSYEVLNDRFKNKGFKFQGNIQSAIEATISMIRAVGE